MNLPRGIAGLVAITVLFLYSAGAARSAQDASKSRTAPAEGRAVAQQGDKKAAVKRTKRGGTVVLRRGNRTFQGTLLSLNADGVKMNSKIKGRSVKLEFRRREISSLTVNGEPYTWNEELKGYESAREIAQRQRTEKLELERLRARSLVCRNKSGKEVVVTITGLRDEYGADQQFDIDLGSKAVDVIEGLRETFSNAKTARPVVYRFKPEESGRLSKEGTPIVTSRVQYTLTTPDGSVQHVRECDGKAEEFAIEILPQDLHTPVLVDLGTWRIQQNVVYSLTRARAPIITTIEKPLFFGDPYLRTTGGEEYDRVEKHVPDTATISALVTNPTAHSLHVKIVLGLHTDALIQTRERQTIEFEIGPKMKDTIYYSFNARSLFGNRTLERVETLDITTRPKN